MKSFRHLRTAILLAAPLALCSVVEAETNTAGSSEQPSEPKFAFEWGGVYALPAGISDLVVQPGPDASIDIALVPVANDSPAAFEDAVDQAVTVFEGEPKAVEPGGEVVPGSQFIQLRVESGAEMRFPVRCAEAGRYALFTQHFADEFQTIFVANDEFVFPGTTRNFRDRFGQIVILPTAVEAFGITIQPASSHELVPSFHAPARVAFNADRVAHVGSAVQGRVAKLPVRPGDVVNEGDTLILVDSPELGGVQSDFLQKRTMATTAGPLAELAKNAAERAKKLFDEGQGISLTEVQKRQSEHQMAEAEKLNAQAGMAAAMDRLKLLGMTEREIEQLAETGKMSPVFAVRAPIGGQIIRRDVTLGALVGPEREALMVVADTTTVWVLADVPELRLADVAVDMPVRITLAAIPGRTFDGVVSFISPDVNEATRTAQIRVEVDNAEGLLRPGMFAQAEIMQTGQKVEGLKKAGTLSVPQSAIQRIEGKPVVFVPFSEKPNTFLKRPVTIGEPVGDMAPVVYGLKEGEPIVTAGTFILKAELGKSSAKHAH